MLTHYPFTSSGHARARRVRDKACRRKCAETFDLSRLVDRKLDILQSAQSWLSPFASKAWLVNGKGKKNWGGADRPHRSVRGACQPGVPCDGCGGLRDRCGGRGLPGEVARQSSPLPDEGEGLRHVLLPLAFPGRREPLPPGAPRPLLVPVRREGRPETLGEGALGVSGDRPDDGDPLGGRDRGRLRCDRVRPWVLTHQSVGVHGAVPVRQGLPDLQGSGHAKDDVGKGLVQPDPLGENQGVVAPRGFSWIPSTFSSTQRRKRSTRRFSGISSGNSAPGWTTRDNRPSWPWPWPSGMPS